LWWLATSAGLVLMCEPISWPKCSRGSPACSTMSVLVGGCCRLLPPLDVPPEDLVPPGRCRFSREVGKVSRLSCRWSSMWSRGPKFSPLAPLMIAAGVAVHLLVVVGSALDEALGESSPDLVSVSTTAASSGCRSPPWRCCWDASCLVSIF
jgi:hypothetical protein